MTLWRWNNQALAEAMPHMDDRDEWREELTGVLSTALQEACEKNDDRAIVTVIDRIAKLNGLDHTHRVDEARLQLDAARIKLMVERMGAALNKAGVPADQQEQVLEALANG